MLHKTRSISSALLEGFLIITVARLIPHAGIGVHTISACPNCWVGNDNGEWDHFGQGLSYMSIDESVDRAIT